jgi:hypothetical protein
MLRSSLLACLLVLAVGAASARSPAPVSTAAPAPAAAPQGPFALRDLPYANNATMRAVIGITACSGRIWRPLTSAARRALR